MKSSTRLRIEYLEKRNMLSVTGMLLAPHAAPPPSSPPGEYAQIGQHQSAHVNQQDADRNAAAMSDASPSLTPIQSSQGLHSSRYAQPVDDSRRPGDQTPNTAGISDATSIPAPIEVSSGLDTMPYAQPVVVVGLVDLAPTRDLNPSGDATDQPVSADPTSGEPGDSANPNSMVPAQSLREAITVVSLDVVVWQGGEAEGVISLSVGFVAPDITMPRHDGQPSSDLEEGPNKSVAMTYQVPHDSPFARDSQLGPLPATNMDALPSATVPMDPAVDGMQSNRGPVGVQPSASSASDQTVSTILETDVAPVDDSSLSPSYLPPSFLPTVKQHGTDMTSASDAVRLSDPVAAAVGTAQPIFGSEANSPVSLAPFSDAVTSNSTEGGYIAVDDAPTNRSPLGNLAANNTALAGVGGAGIDRSNWLTDLLPNSRKSADSDSARKAAPSSGVILADGSSRSARANSPYDDSREGGGIELAIADLAPTAGGDSQGAEGPASDNVDQQISDIRLESDVGLFCDIEVAAAPTWPLGDAQSTGISHQNAGSVVAGAGMHGWKSNVVKEFDRPLTKSSQPSPARLEGELPLVLGVVFLVSRGGLRLEEKVPERERRLQDFRQK